MKKIIAFLMLAAFIACNNKENKDSGIIGKWASEELVTKTHRMTVASKDSMIAADFAQVKAQMIARNDSFSIDDSVSVINESTRVVNQLFNLTYVLNADKSFMISFPNWEDTVRQTGKYTVDEKAGSLTLKIDSLNADNPSKERTLKYELANGKLTLAIDDTTSQVFKKVN
jgi:hypothetical protein